MLFAFVLLFQCLYFYWIDFIDKDLIQPVLHFPYPYLSFIKVLDPVIMYSILFVMIVSSLALIIGFMSRLFSFIFFLCFTYLWMIDKGIFNNHYYLLSLLLLLFCFIRSDRYLSISKRKEKENKAWELLILQFQFSLVLIYAGFNKLNYWWLVKHEPVHHILLGKAQMNENELWNSLLLEYVLVWGGLLFDLFIIPMLIWSKTRKMAIILFFIFNGLNTWIFYDIGEIGIFPLLMLSSLVLFVSESSLINILRKTPYKYRVIVHSKDLQSTKHNYSIYTLYLLVVYVLIQLLFPLRHHLFEGNVDYTGEGQRFSWRMKSMYKDFRISFLLKDERRGISANLDPRSVLTVKQYTNLGYYPELIIPVAENLRNAAKEKGVLDPKIYVDFKVGFMGMKPQYLLSPELELSEIKYSPLQHSAWILPLEHD